jgi:Sec-independent protein secretion pathway component TatC
MSDTTAFGLAQRTHSMPLLAHLEELRKRIIVSVVGVLAGVLLCWSFADRIFGLMQQPSYSGAASSWDRRRVGVSKPD